MTLLDFAILACTWGAFGLAWGVRYFNAMVLGLELEGATAARRLAQAGLPECERLSAESFAEAVLDQHPPPPAWMLAAMGVTLWASAPRRVGEAHAQQRARSV